MLLEKLCTLNILNYVHSLKNYVCWKCIIVCILCENFYFGYTKLWTLFQKSVYIEFTKLCIKNYLY